jgi:hypothetical protein
MEELILDAHVVTPSNSLEEIDEQRQQKLKLTGRGVNNTSNNCDGGITMSNDAGPDWFDNLMSGVKITNSEWNELSSRKVR